MDEEVDMSDITYLRSLMKMLFRFNSHWLWLEYNIQWDVYVREEIYFTCIILETIKRKEVPWFNVVFRNLVGFRSVLQDVDMNDLSPLVPLK